MLHQEITAKILRAFFNVYNNLGFGFLEKNYENAMLIELQSMGMKCTNQDPIKVYYKGEVIGDYFADIIVDGKVIVELKSASSIIPRHEVQLLNYLRATHMEVGLLLNFGEEPAFRRKVFENGRKKS